LNYLNWYFIAWKDPGRIELLDHATNGQNQKIPKIPIGCLKPTEEEKKKIQDFIDRHEAQEMDPLTEMIV